MDALGLARKRGLKIAKTGGGCDYPCLACQFFDVLVSAPGGEPPPGLPLDGVGGELRFAAPENCMDDSAIFYDPFWQSTFKRYKTLRAAINALASLTKEKAEAIATRKSPGWRKKLTLRNDAFDGD